MPAMWGPFPGMTGGAWWGACAVVWTGSGSGVGVGATGSGVVSCAVAWIFGATGWTGRATLVAAVVAVVVGLAVAVVGTGSLVAVAVAVSAT